MDEKRKENRKKPEDEGSPWWRRSWDPWVLLCTGSACEAVTIVVAGVARWSPAVTMTTGLLGVGLILAADRARRR
ncbi:hypothetical protein EKG83_39710 [Saccharothrix syringae]|uniref:Uncharacterized protein n=1 Tax=Saccharothrix syringae TaxID=103733 RepID=A0A5Q0HAQ7_SACSY|nr:hypothetical protein EKG83_39710 [Saccharothrix syringae]